MLYSVFFFLHLYLLIVKYFHVRIVFVEGEL
jgi:hypothetical protein